MKPVLALVALLALADPARTDPVAQAAVNAYRADKGRAALSYSDDLQTIALAHALDMARGGFFAHTGSDGGGLAERLRAGGYRYCFAAENIARGQRTLEAVMQSWTGSAGHRKNLIHRSATEFGLARAPGDIWVMVLAAPGC